MWPQVLERVQQLRRFTWVMLSQNAQVAGVDGDTLTISLINAGARDSFVKSGNDAIVRQALSDVLAVQWRVETIVDPSAAPPGDAAPPPAPEQSAPGPSRVPDSVREALRTGPVASAPADPDADADPNDPVVDDGSHDAAALLAEHLGAEVIDESPSS